MLTFTYDPQVNVTRQTEVRPTICLSCFHYRKVEKKKFNQKLLTLNFKVCDLDLKKSEGVGMVQRKSLDQFLISGHVSTRSSLSSEDIDI